VQKRRRNGAVDSPMIQMGGGALTDGIYAFNLAIVALPNNTSLVFFSAQRNGASGNDAFDIFVQRMSASFEKVGGPIAVNTSLAGAQTGVMATRLSDGNVMVVWESAAVGFTSSTIRGRVVQPNGQGASPERTVIRQTTGFSTPRALSPTANGALLAYSRIVGPAADTRDSKGGPPPVEKGIQQLTIAGVVTLPFRKLDTGTADRPFGSPGLQWTDPSNPDPSAYVSLFTETGNATEFHRFDLMGSSPPVDDFIRNLRVPPGFSGAPQGAKLDYHMVDYDFVALHTETAAGANTVTAMLLRQNGAVAAMRVLGPFEEDFMNPTAGIVLLPFGDMPHYKLGLARGNTFLDDRSYVFGLTVGYDH
jgi:hypothetical protein